MSNDRVELSKYRMQKAREDLANSARNLDDDFIKGSINRSYYAIFHAMRALLALDLFDSKKHSGIISYFLKNYVISGKFEREHSLIVRDAFAIRNKSDYDDFFVVGRQEAAQQLANAQIFLDVVQDFLEPLWLEPGDQV